MPTDRQLETLQVYAGFLEEVKIQIASIEAALRGGTPFPGPIVREFCYLQLRMLCELIALGCLVAHGDIRAAQSKDLQKEWSAYRIMDALEKLHPGFYPRP